ncbi:oxygenase MpaB family protein [Janthinobacterium sp. B9-8]|uniref:oxygenase MpaB family protein n=1 Tax=Janthinobacterium sp. B9-8 TaxID=1236179 RepID=UPI00061CFD7A|nr:oxygenase MpaB family protein [Janthinobacterium sp. B9-8]AMC33462.1 hypothetical protein VN23_02030 [Janthinobacterium sp. B9-8]
MNAPIWSDATLDQLKMSADPLADQCMRDLILAGNISKTNQILAQLDVDKAWPDDTPPKLLAYLEATASLSDDVDFARLERAQAFFTAYGIPFGISLMCRSLPVLYAGRVGGAQLLAATGQLSGHFERRASETLRFILNVAEPGSLSPQGKGLLTIRKVRLMHAAIRHFARSKQRDSQDSWHADWGMPINQEELIGTMLAFSFQALEGMRVLGVKVSQKQEDDQLYLWRVIGRALGINPDAMPVNASQAREVWKALERRNFGSSDAGHLLTQAHIAFLQANLPDLAAGLVPELMTKLLGRRNAHFLGLQKKQAWGWVLDLLRFIFRLKSRLANSSHTAESFMREYGEFFMEALQKHWAGPYPGRAFQIPDQLRAPATAPQEYQRSEV